MSGVLPPRDGGAETSEQEETTSQGPVDFQRGSQRSSFSGEGIKVKILGKKSTSAYAGDVQEPEPDYDLYLNLYVFLLWDKLRATGFAVYFVITVVMYHLNPHARFGVGGDVETESTGTVGHFLQNMHFVVIVLEVLQYMEIVIMLLCIKALIWPHRPLSYILCDKILKWWHKGKAPYLPIDSRSQVVQMLCLCSVFLMTSILFRSIPSPTVAESTVSKLVPTFSIIGNNLIHSCWAA